MDESIINMPGEAATCRICRSEGTLAEPLFHPCRCSGSIRNVHQECLVEWLSHSQKKHCELCKTPFCFTKLYDAQMPAVLPWTVFTKRALIHVINGTLRAIRALLVVTIWMVILPWIIRWAWRWMFWLVDAGWAREIYLKELRKSPGYFIQHMANSTAATNTTWDGRGVTQTLQDAVAMENATTPHFLYDFALKFLIPLAIETLPNTTNSDTPHPWKHSDASIFSSLSYISALTPYPPVNRVLLDIFEGQLITCTVILAFILVFLIREWVVQQQPLVNPDRLREQREQAQIARRRLELLEQARRTLEELEASSTTTNDSPDGGTEMESMESVVPADRQLRRPRMPERDASSRAIRVQRLIEEADAILGPQQHPDSDAEPSSSGPFATVGNISPSEGASKDISNSAFSELPITNAGPDAKLNIIRRVNGKAAAVPAPKPSRPLISNEELQDRLTAITSEDAVPEPSLPQPAEHAGAVIPPEDTVAPMDASAEQGVETALDLADHLIPSEDEEPVLDPDDLDVDSDEQAVRRPEDLLGQTAFEKLADWFWGDIYPNVTPQTPIQADEQILAANGDANPAPFVPIVNGVALPNNDLRQPNHDPEVVAAAQQAGLDAEAVDDAEDIEGILELIGLQGPLAGLLQTSLFCLLLVICTVAGAVVIPYMWGKLVLIMLDQPLIMPIGLLRMISGLGSLLIDAIIFVGSWLLTIGAVSTEAFLGVLRSFSSNPYLSAQFVSTISRSALAEANASGTRLFDFFTGEDGLDLLDVNATFLHASVASHIALNNLKAEFNVVLAFFASIFRKVFDVVIMGKVNDTLNESLELVKNIPSIFRGVGDITWPYVQAITDLYTGLKSGNLDLPSPPGTGPWSPALTYWSSTDRTFAVCAGYAALACLAAIYVAADTAITRDWQKTEKIVRNSLRQAGGVFKVILIISIEMLVFPLYCGMLLDVAFLPLFASATITSRIAFATTAPYVFCFVHWFIGTCYMFHFALFVGMCRKILRKGVLWFIRDPDDPTFHPVRDVLERNVTTQLRKIAFSALVYGALVILCLGGVIWGIGKVFSGIFPIYWAATEPTVEFPVDLLLYNFVTPLVVRLFKPSEIIHAMYAWWLRKCARMLRLSHFLFDDRKIDEEEPSRSIAWSSLHRPLEPLTAAEKLNATEPLPSGDPGVTQNGRYVLTPSTDQYRPPKPGEAFLHIDDDDVYIADKDGKRNESFAKVYIPPLFKTRVTLFMVCLWIFSAFAGLCVSLLPLILGRKMLGAAVPGVMFNDIYAYSIGISTLGGAITVARKGSSLFQKLRGYVGNTTVAAVLGTARFGTLRVAKVAYFYGFVFLLLPMMIGIIIETHLILPLHTYFILQAAGVGRMAWLFETTMGSLSNSTLPSSTNSTFTEHAAAIGSPLPMHHTIHVVQDLALGVLVLRILVRTILSDRNSRASELARRLKRNGRFDPDTRLATRYLILPASIVATIMLLLPPAIARVSISGLCLTGYDLGNDHIAMLYRLSYPATSACLITVLLLKELGVATTRWRARIRDEVYLVGERLHNFGEKRPPIGSRSIMRRDIPAQRG